jgi:hypothetical protein
VARAHRPYAATSPRAAPRLPQDHRGALPLAREQDHYRSQNSGDTARRRHAAAFTLAWPRSATEIRAP